jgi:hypothetical protein
VAAQRTRDRRLLQLQALDVIDALQRGHDELRARDRQPAGLAGAGPRAGVCAACRSIRGHAVRADGGRVQLSTSSPLWPLPKNRRAGQPPS